MPSSTTAARARPNHLRLVRADEVRAPRVRVGPSDTTRDRTRARADRAITLLLASSGLLTLAGLVMVLSASSVSAYSRYGSSFLFFQRQAGFAVAGSVLLWITMRMRYAAWQRLCFPFLLATVVLLGLVLHPSFGTIAGGSARWIELGPVTIQPSEPAKLAVITFLATMLARRWKRLADVRQLALPLVPVVGLVVLLILLQPDMGTAMIVVGIAFLLAFTAGARLKHLAVAAVATLAGSFGLMYVEGYRWARFLSFTDPWADPQGSGYQTIQSLIGLASSGPLGVGLGASRQKWSYVPNAHTDFIFSIIGEELGLVGTIAILGLFGLLLYAGIRIAVRAPDAFGRLLAAGITGWFGVQALINLGAVTGLLPITGVPLPFVSFGGSSLVVSLAAVGILVSIGRASAASRGR